MKIKTKKKKKKFKKRIYWVGQKIHSGFAICCRKPKGSFRPPQYLTVKSARFDGGNRRWKEEGGERKKTILEDKSKRIFECVCVS